MVFHGGGCLGRRIRAQRERSRNVLSLVTKPIIIYLSICCVAVAEIERSLVMLRHQEEAPQPHPRDLGGDGLSSGGTAEADAASASGMPLRAAARRAQMQRQMLEKATGRSLSKHHVA
jgi:hypothetical protein